MTPREASPRSIGTARDRAEAAQPRVLAETRAPGRVGVHVNDVLHGAGPDRPISGRVLRRGARRLALRHEGLAAPRRGRPRRRQADQPVLVPEHRTDQAPNSRIALSAMASKTGWTSAGAPAITVRISPVAAWRSSASAQRVLEAGALRPLLDERGLQGLDQRAELRPIV